MKKLGLILVTLILFAGCRKSDIVTPDQITGTDLKIASSVGIKLQSAFVTSEVAMNVKSDVAQTVTVKIFDIANKVVNIVYLITKLLPLTSTFVAVLHLRHYVLI